MKTDGCVTREAFVERSFLKLKTVTLGYLGKFYRESISNLYFVCVFWLSEIKRDLCHQAIQTYSLN